MTTTGTSRRRAAGLLFFVAGSAVAGLVWAALALVGAGEGDVMPGSASPRLAASNLRSSLVRGTDTVARFAAGSIRVGNPRLVGPFRIGFLDGIEARDVVVETFERTGPTASGSGSANVASQLLALAARDRAVPIVSVDVARAKIVRYRDGREVFSIQARRCRAGAGARTVACENGVLRQGDSWTLFRRVTFDAKTWAVARVEPAG